MSDIPIDRKFSVLSEISRAQHFAWREAVKQLCPEIDPTEVVLRMWTLTGEQTAASYAKRINSAQPLAPQVAGSIVWSSQCMGEDAVLETGDGEEEAFVRHDACPWLKWHERCGAVAEDKPGCDEWFASTFAVLGDKLGRTIRFETLQALPDGDPCCRRRVWVED